MKGVAWWKDQSGQGLPEYALLIAAVVLMAVIVSLTFTAGIEALFNNVLDHFDGTPPPPPEVEEP